MQSDPLGKVMIRDATPSDKPAWAALWQDYLTFYDITLDPAVTARTWARIMDADHALNCRLACQGDQVLGFAIHLHHASTWVMGDGSMRSTTLVTPRTTSVCSTRRPGTCTPGMPPACTSRRRPTYDQRLPHRTSTST